MASNDFIRGILRSQRMSANLSMHLTCDKQESSLLWRTMLNDAHVTGLRQVGCIVEELLHPETETAIQGQLLLKHH